MNKIVSFGLVIGAMIVLVGCGGGGTPTTSTVAEKGLGTYNDSAVSGVSYTCGTETGVTDANGTFTYDIGTSCTFSIEDIILSIIGSSSLSDENATILVEDIAVAQFLQSIDLDGNASNGITITPEIIDVLIEGNVTTLPSNLEELEAAVTLLEDTAAEDNSTLEYTGTVVTEAEAEAHLEETKATLDVTAPVITIAGNNPLIITQDATNFSAPESNVTDDFYDDINATVTGLGILNTAVPGTYTLTYTAVDGAGNSSSKALTVIVQDIIIPVITLSGATPQTLEVKTAYVELGATAVDNTDGDISANISIDTSAVDTNTLGSYTVTYNVQDAAGNPATQVTRTVNVIDTVAPVIALNGEVVVTLSVGESYVEAGATVTDNSGETIVAQRTGVVDSATPGTYTLYYDAADSSSNVATQVTRTVNVVDVVAPVVTLAGINPQELEVNTDYVELGATANDVTDGDRPVTIDIADVDMSTLGAYTVTYSSTDEAGNRGEATRTVNVVDTTAPVITLTGSSAVTLVEGEVFDDQGATCLDNYDTECSVTASGMVGTDIGSYTITYDAIDNSGNAATSVSRTVEVVENTAPVFILPSTYYIDVRLGTHYDNGQQYSQFEAEQFNFSADGLSFTELVFINGEFILDLNENTNTGYVLDSGAWVLESDTLSIVLSVNGTVATLDGIHKLTISSVQDITDEVVNIDGTDANVTMPSGSERTTMVHELIADEYGIDEQARTYGNTANEFYISLSEVVQYQCGTRWFTDAKEGSGIVGISFTCGQETQTSGTLVGVQSDNTLVHDVGTWEIITLPDSFMQAIVTTINPEYQAYSDTPLFAENGTEIWRGWYNAVGMIENMTLYNQAAFDAMSDKIVELENPPGVDYVALLGGKTFYNVGSDWIDSVVVDPAVTSLTWTQILGGDANGTDLLAINGDQLIVTSGEDGSTFNLVLAEETADYLLLNIIDTNGSIVEQNRFYFAQAVAEAYYASLQPRTPTLESLIVGQTYYVTTCDHVETLVFGTDGNLTDTWVDNNGSTQEVIMSYSVDGEVLTVNIPGEGTKTFSNPVQTTDWITFTNTEGQESGRFFFDYNTAEGTLSYDCPIEFTTEMLTGKIVYDSDTDDMGYAESVMLFNETNLTRQEFWYYDNNDSLRQVNEFTLSYELIDGKIKGTTDDSYIWITLLAYGVDDSWIVEKAEDINQTGEIDEFGGAEWYTSKPSNFTSEFTILP